MSPRRLWRPRRGAAEFVGGWRQTLENLDAVHHLIICHVISIDGDQATCAANMQGTHVLANSSGGPMWTVGGRHDSQLKRTPDGWRIAGLTFTIEWATGNEHIVAPQLPEDGADCALALAGGYAILCVVARRRPLGRGGRTACRRMSIPLELKGAIRLDGDELEVDVTTFVDHRNLGMTLEPARDAAHPEQTDCSWAAVPDDQQLRC